MEKRNMVVLIIVAIMAVIVFAGCDKAGTDTVAADSKAQKKHTIRVIVPEEIKDQVQFELHIQPASQAITVKESAATTAPAVQHKEPEAPKAEATTPVAPDKKDAVHEVTINQEEGWFNRKWTAIKTWWNA